MKTNLEQISLSQYSGLFLLLTGASYDLALKQIDTLEGRETYIDGVTARYNWKDLQLDCNGNYDFSWIDAHIGRLQQLKRDGKLNLEIFATKPPECVVQGSAQTWLYPLSRSKGGAMLKIPVPWDNFSLSQWRKFNIALANHQLPDIAANNNQRRLKRHSGMGSVMASIQGFGLIRDRSEVNSDANAIWEEPGYSRDKLMYAINHSMATATRSFPMSPVSVGLFNFNDGQLPKFDDAIISWFAEKYSRVGGFMENLKGHTPAAVTGRKVLPIVRLNEEGVYDNPPTWLQACGVWSTAGLCKFGDGDDNPMAGIYHAADNLHAYLVELYPEDIKVFGPRLQKSRDHLKQKF